MTLRATASTFEKLGGSLIVAFVASIALGVPAAAQDIEPETSIKGRLEKIDNDDREPVEGVTITVELDGAGIGVAVSGSDGSWEISVDVAGIYQVSLDLATLPDGVAPTDPNRMTLTDVDVRDGQNKTVRFNLGPGISSNVSDLDRLKDLFVFGLKLGAIIALAAVGLSLIFGVTDLVNFAHAEMITLGAVIAFFFNSSRSGPGWPLLMAAVPAIVLSAGFAAAQESALWRPLRRRKVGAIAILVISIGLSFAVRNIILVLIGGAPKSYTDFVIQERVNFLGFVTPPKNLVIIGSSIVILGAVGLFLQRTQAGVAVRAVADSKDLAESSGINVSRVIMITWLLGGSLAGLSGVFLGVSERVEWNLGFKVLLLVFAAVVLGGLGTAFGAMLGGFVVGLSVEMSTFWIPTELKNAVAMAVLIGMLLWRPQGLLGMRERIG
jgi:neutral amino acid transport system permease protein